MAIKRGIDKAVEVAVEELKKLSKPVSGDMIAQVGSISANSDPTIGNIIAEAMKKVGKDGVITVEESKSMTTELETVEACSSTAATSHRTLSPTPSAWSASSRTLTSSFTRRRSAT